MRLKTFFEKAVFGILAGFVFALQMSAANDAHAEEFAYVVNSGGDSVSVIDTSTNMVVGSPIPVGALPFGIAVTPNGSFAYVTNQVSGNVSVINTSTNTVVDTIVVGAGPFGIAVSPDGSVAYVTNQASNNVSVINTSTNTVVDTIPLGGLLGFIDFTPDGLFAYITSDDGNVSVIDTTTNMVADTIPIGDTPVGVDITPDGLFAYVTNQTSGNVLVIDTTTNMVADTIPLGTQPGLIEITPDGLFAYITNSDNAVSVIDTSTNMVVDTIPVGDTPIGIAVTPDGLFTYVTNVNDNSVSVIDTSTNMVFDTIPVGTGPFGIALGPPVVEVNITKLTVPADGTGFPFTSTGFSELFNCEITSAFTLDDLETASCTVPPGNYTITEDIPEGQVLTISCTELPETFNMDSLTGTLEFTVANPLENVDCTFINSFAGTVVRVLDEPVGANCRFGGTRIESGFDLNQNGVLDDGEVIPQDTAFICNGEPEDVVPPGPGPEDPVNPIIDLNDEPPGDNCINGGVRIDTGLDLNRNGVLDPEEITETSFVCVPSGEDDDNQNGGGSSNNGCSTSLVGPGKTSDLSDLLGLIALPLIVILGRRLRRKK